MKGKSWHLRKDLGKRAIVSRFDVLIPDDMPPSAYLPTRERYFQDLSRAALRHNLVWMPATGDVTAIGPHIPSGDELMEVLHGILNNTGIRTAPAAIDHVRGVTIGEVSR
jgi:hypothetical protein